MSFRKFLSEHYVNEAKDPPMLLQLRRQGIRNFPNGERVALFTNPQLKIQIAVPYDSVTGSLKPSNMLPIKEQLIEHGDKSESKEEMISCLQHAYKATLVPQPTELQTAIHNWLKSELEEYGDWSDMPEDVLADVHCDFDALVKGSSLEKELLGEHARPSRKLNSYPDWYEQMEKKHNDVAFKLHDGGNKTSAYLNGKHLGTFDHKNKQGEIREELIQESPLHRINTILRTGKEDHVTFHNGASARVHPNTARVVHGLYHKVNSHNRAKLSELINSSPEGLVKVARFADELSKKNSKEA